MHPHGHNLGEVKRPHGIAGKAALEAAILGQGETDGVEVGHKLGEGMRSHKIAVEAGLKNQPFRSCMIHTPNFLPISSQLHFNSIPLLKYFVLI